MWHRHLFTGSFGDFKTPLPGQLYSVDGKKTRLFVDGIFAYDAIEGVTGIEAAATFKPDEVFASGRVGALTLTTFWNDDAGYALSPGPTINELDISLALFNNMTVSQVFLYVNSVNDQPSATEIDVTGTLAPSGGTYTYNVGAPNALRYYWLKLIDGSGNQTIESLGTYTTQDNTSPSITSFTLSAGTPATTAIDVAMGATDNDAVQTLYLWLSDTQSVQPTAAAIKTSGIALAGNTTSYSATSLTPGTTYYGWLLAQDAVGNESGVQPSVPANLTTTADVTPPSLDSFSLTATSGAEETSVDITISISDVVG